MNIKFLKYGSKKVSPLVDSFAKGLDKHNVQYSWMNSKGVENCDLIISWGYRRKKIIEEQKRNGGDYLTIERGFMGDRMKWTSAGFNGICGTAEYILPDIITHDRLNENFPGIIEPMRKKGHGDYILIIGQNPSDANIDCNFQEWLEFLNIKLKHEKLPVYFRRHPAGVHRKHPFKEIGGTLEYALSRAELVITYSSTVGVEATLKGIKTIADGLGSMIPKWSETREEWAAKLAWKQWTQEEFEDGTTWDILSKKYV